MIVAFDNSVLCLLLHPDAECPPDPATGGAVTRPRERMEHLVEQLRAQSARILIPTPALSEFLTFASSDYLAAITNSRHFEIASFDQLAAVEAGLTLKRDLAGPRGKRAGATDPWQKVKVDRQIVAVAKVKRAERLYTTDQGLAALARQSGIAAIGVAELPLPPSPTPLLDTEND